MKRKIIVLLVIATTISLCGCGNTSSNLDNQIEESNINEETTEEPSEDLVEDQALEDNSDTSEESIDQGEEIQPKEGEEISEDEEDEQLDIEEKLLSMTDEINLLAMVYGQCLCEAQAYESSTVLSERSMDSLMYYFIALGSYTISEINYDMESGWSASKENVDVYASVLKEGTTEFKFEDRGTEWPEIHYDAGTDTYLFGNGEAGCYVTEIESAEQKDDELHVNAALYAVDYESDEDRILVIRIELVLVNNPNKKAQDKGFTCSVRDCYVIS